MVKITFLGTGSAGGCPREGHADALCRAARLPGSKTARRRSSAFVTADRARLLIDAGPDILDQLRTLPGGRQARDMDAVFLTHEHSDATGGLLALDRWLSRRKHTCPLYALRGTVNALTRREIVLARLRPMALPPFRPLTVRGVPITPFPVVHGIRLDCPTAGYRIGGLVYASDMESASPRSLGLMRRAELLVLDCALWARKSLPGHLTVPEAIALARRLRPRSLVLTQIGHGVPVHEEAEQLVRVYAKRQGVPFAVRLAYDGLRLKV